MTHPNRTARQRIRRWQFVENVLMLVAVVLAAWAIGGVAVKAVDPAAAIIGGAGAALTVAVLYLLVDPILVRLYADTYTTRRQERYCRDS